MNKAQIVRMLAERLDITLVDSRIYLNTLLDIVVEGVITDEKVGIHEFGKIFILPQSRRQFRNPRTGEKVMLTPRKTIRLKPCEALIDKINKQ